MTESPATRIAARPLAEIGISAHRGASIDHPENTLASFRAALEAGAEGVETDIALSREGVPVLMHDGTVDRTTNGAGAVDSLTVEELRALDAGQGEPVPTLEDLLELVGDRAEINIELKDPRAAGPVLDVVRRHPEVRWFSSSAQWEALAELRALSPESRLYPLTLGQATMADMRELAVAAGYDAELIDREFARFPARHHGLDDALAFAAQIHAEGLSAIELRMDAAVVERIHDAGLLVWAWTINDPHRAAELMELGVDAICTDDPATMLALRQDLDARIQHPGTGQTS